MVSDAGGIGFEEVLEELDAEVYFTLISTIEGQEVVAVDKIGHSCNGLIASLPRQSVRIPGEDTSKHLAEHEEVLNGRQIWAHCNEDFSYLHHLLLHPHTFKLSDVFTPFADIVNDGGVYGQIVADYERPKGLATSRRQSMLPERF